MHKTDTVQPERLETETFSIHNESWKVDLAKWQVTSLVKNQLHSSERSIDGEWDCYFRRRVDLNSTACTSTNKSFDIFTSFAINIPSLYTQWGYTNKQKFCYIYIYIYIYARNTVFFKIHSQMWLIAMVSLKRSPVTNAPLLKFWSLPVGVIWLHACSGALLETKTKNRRVSDRQPKWQR